MTPSYPCPPAAPAPRPVFPRPEPGFLRRLLVAALSGGALALLTAPVANAQLYTESQTLFGDPNPGEYFGDAKVSASGDTLVVGTGPNGRVYVFVHSATGWNLQQKFTAHLSSYSEGPVVVDGDTLVAGSEIYVRSGGTWTLQQSLPFQDPWPALQGDTLVIGEIYTGSPGGYQSDGSLYVYVRSGTAWTLQAHLLPDTPGLQGNLGKRVAIDGDTIVASTAGESGGAYVFVRNGTTWTRQARLPSPSGSAWMSVAIEGNTIATSDPANNLVHIWERSGTGWNRTATIPLPATGGNYFGDELALSGGLLSAYAEGIFYLFSKTSSGWVLAQTTPWNGNSFGVLDLANRGKTYVLTNPFDHTQNYSNGIVKVFTVPPPPAPGGGWRDADVGAVGVAGGSTDNSGTVSVSGSGSDIWDRTDEFHFRTESLTGDGAIIARLNSTGSGDPWAKVGLMFREDVAPSSRAVMALVTPGGHLGTQARDSTADRTWFQDSGWADAPIWLMLARSGNLFAAYRSDDGNNWTPMATFGVTMPATIHAGLAVSSHDNSTSIAATFSDIEIVATPPPGPLNAPSNLTGSLFNGTSVRLQWTDNSVDESGFNVERAIGAGSDAFAVIKSVDANVTQFTDGGLGDNTTYTYRVRAVRYRDIPSAPSNTFMITPTTQPPGALTGDDLGTAGVPGTYTDADGVLTIDAAGSDIWGEADSGYFVHREITGDFDIRARVTSLMNTHPWAKAGLMVRERLEAGSQNVFTLLTADNVAGMQVRDTLNGPTSFTAGPWVRAPYWVRLVRTGSTFQSLISEDGVIWQSIGAQDLVLPPTLLAGVAVTSHAPAAKTQATVSSLGFNAGTP